MRTRALLLFGLAWIVGCGSSKYAPVSGTVRMDGKPLADVAVIFQPIGKTLNPGPGSSGRTNAQGEYTLEVMGGEGRGAVIGPHRVEIHPTVEADGSRKAPKIQIPRKYNYTSELKFEVKPDGNTADFNLTSK